MRKAGLVVSVLFVLVTVVVSALAANRGFKDGKAIKGLISQLSGEEANHPAAKELKSMGSKLQFAGVMYALAAVAAIATVVTAFRRKKTAIAAGALVLFSLVATFLSPDKSMSLGAASLRSVGYVGLVCGIVAAAAAIAASRAGGSVEQPSGRSVHA